jgi:hypothetical protein
VTSIIFPNPEYESKNEAVVKDQKKKKSCLKVKLIEIE